LDYNRFRCDNCQGRLRGVPPRASVTLDSISNTPDGTKIVYLGTPSPCSYQHG